MDIIKGLKGLKGSLPVHLVSSFYVHLLSNNVAHIILFVTHIKLHSTTTKNTVVMEYRNIYFISLLLGASLSLYRTLFSTCSFISSLLTCTMTLVQYIWKLCGVTLNEMKEIIFSNDFNLHLIYMNVVHINAICNLHYDQMRLYGIWFS